MIQNQQQLPVEEQQILGIERVKSGRKKKEQTSRYLETPMNPYYKIYEKLIQYLERIGLIHGLCFTPELRKSLKMHNKYAELRWKDQGKGWEYLDQINDIKKDQILMKRIRRIMFSIKRRARKYKKLTSKQNQEKTSQCIITSNNLDKWTLNKLIDFIIRPGQMVDGQCRKQFYTLNTSILESIFVKKSQMQSMPKLLALKFFRQCIFFSRKFTSYKKKNWIQIKKCNEQEMEQKFIRMYFYFRMNFKDIIYNFCEWDQYNEDMKQLFEEQTRNLDGVCYQFNEQNQIIINAQQSQEPQKGQQYQIQLGQPSQSK